MKIHFMNQEEILKKVRDFADEAHGTQMRKYTPERYIVHPERVMHTCKTYTEDISMLAAALLHDVLEDTSVTRDELLNFLKGLMSLENASHCVYLVEELSDVYVKETFPKLNRNKRKKLELKRIIRTSADAQTIKYADILDNCREIVRYDREFAPQFLFECNQILNSLNLGNKELKDRALEMVDIGLKELRVK